MTYTVYPGGITCSLTPAWLCEVFLVKKPNLVLTTDVLSTLKSKYDSLWSDLVRERAENEEKNYS